MQQQSKPQIVIQPQKGPQTRAFACGADILFYGGQAGGGKTFFITTDPLRHFNNYKFKGVIFRRTTPQLTNPGSVLDKCLEAYVPLGVKSNLTDMEFIRPNGPDGVSGWTIKLAHLEHEKNIYDWQGSEIDYIGFDEVTHFTKKQFFYMISRLRSLSGVLPYIRCTCNPDPDSWVRSFLSWYIKGDDYPAEERGYPIPERDGVIRWFVQKDNEIIWGDHKFDPLATSVTFIAAKLSDNQILLKKNPGYLAAIQALPYVERMALGEGNWDVRAAAGNCFKKSWFKTVDASPLIIRRVRYWDRASSKKKKSAWTVGVLMGLTADKQVVIEHVERIQGTPLEVENTIKNTASNDGVGVEVILEHDPGQAGDFEIAYYSRLLIGYIMKANRVNQDKVTRSKPYSSAAEQGNVLVRRGPWNEKFLDEHESFPDIDLKDQVDAGSGAFFMLTNNNTGEFSKQHAEKRASKLLQHEEY